MSSPSEHTQSHSCLVSPEILLSLSVAPLILGVLGGKAIANFLQEAGQMSEELFRGDRLPTLNFPPSSGSQSV
ncbi:MAG: hypothetical protein VKJ46_10280 [Leptolyngbyaceae bacterium]|nr:hypothetical protein [Leptolyngbyaceae bacterium]